MTKHERQDVKSKYLKLIKLTNFKPRNNFRKISLTFTCAIAFLLLSIPTQGEDGETKQYVQVNLKEYVNMEFRDKIEGDRAGGWSDRGVNDLRGFPAGFKEFGGIPFEVINPAENKRKSLIILKSKGRLYFPESVKGLHLNKRVAKLFFLNSSDTSSPRGHIVAKYIVHYDNGLQEEMPVRYGMDTANSWLKCNENDIPNAKVVWTGKNPQAEIGVFLSSWKNPYPAIPVKSIDFVSTGSDTSPALIAMTAEIAINSQEASYENDFELLIRLQAQEKTIRQLQDRVSLSENRILELEQTITKLNEDMTKLWNREASK